jgi:hypothetical protein
LLIQGRRDRRASQELKENKAQRVIEALKVIQGYKGLRVTEGALEELQGQKGIEAPEV